MKGLLPALLVAVAWSASLAAQESDRSLERISISLQQPPPLVRNVTPDETAAPKRLGIFTLIPATGRGEIVRVSIPIGELVTRPFKAAAAAHRRRQEAA